VRPALRVGILAVAFAIGTGAFGWWAVPAIAALWGLIAGRHSARASAIAAPLAWGVLIATAALRGAPIGTFVSSLAGAMALPAWLLLSAEFTLPLMLAWSATALFGSIRERPHGKI
jgi:hypothetical protein